MSRSTILAMATPAPTGQVIILTLLVFVGMTLVGTSFFFEKKKRWVFWALFLLGVCLFVGGIIFLLLPR